MSERVEVTSEPGAAPPQPSSNGEPLLEVKNLKKYFPVKKGILIEKTIDHVKAVDDVSF
jgi:microcin C transport system ATP-binding protein